MNKYDVIIIGAGPAGISSAISCAKQGLRVGLLEKNKSIGRKILITGGGKCNVTQDMPTGALLHHYGTNQNFVKPALYAYTNTEFRKFLNRNGLSTTAVENGKVFPKSMKAMDVVRTFAKICQELKVDTLSQTEVQDIIQTETGFEVVTQNSTFYSNNVVVSTGGLSFPQTGSTGDGYIFAKKFGHKIRPTKFALAPLFIKNFKMADLSGLSLQGLQFSTWRNNKKFGEYLGDVLITHKGLSGPGVINASRDIVKSDIIKLNFYGGRVEQSRETITKLLSSGGKKLVRTVVNEIDLPKRLLNYLLDEAGIDSQLKCADLPKKTRTKIINSLIEYEMEIKEVGNATNAMVTAGGVHLKEVSPKTMESRMVKGLYFAGEVLDVDGDTGGYNIQIAVSMGYLIGEAIGQKYK